jgi:hypothetical protein
MKEVPKNAIPNTTVPDKETPLAIPTDDRFAVNVSESMEIRNILRAGLVEAQGRDSEKIPLFVSWPNWLEDGIVCLYARDLRQLLLETVRDTAGKLGKIIEEP